jgi:hypothetical protein
MGENIVYVVGRFFGLLDSNAAWEIIGIFDDEDEAVRQCRNEDDFVGPIELNKVNHKEKEPWPGCYYPLESIVSKGDTE